MSLALALLALALAPSPSDPQEAPVADWTILFYGASDNSSEESFCPDMEAARRSLAPDADVTLLALVDRSPGFSSTEEGFGEDFADTRLYRLTPDGPRREAGGEAFPELTADGSFEADTGDAATLRKALRWARSSHPARRTALVFYSHGSGPFWCPDDTDGGDRLFTAELTDVLGAEDSVDLMVFDVCLMAGVENAYQWRPGTQRFSADVMVATPMAGFPFPWHRILGRLRPGEAPDGAPAWLDPARATAADLGRLVVEETERHRAMMLAEPGPERFEDQVRGEAMTCVDLAAVGAVKERLDALALTLLSDEGRALAEAVRGSIADPRTVCYTLPEERGRFPFVDLYDLALRLAEHPDADAEVRRQAKALAEAVDAAVLASYGEARYDVWGGFQAGRHGLYVTFPDAAGWRTLRWYHPERLAGPDVYGHYAWCADGATAGDDEVGNWFELLDAWFDEYDEAGGVNGYRW